MHRSIAKGLAFRLTNLCSCEMQRSSM